MSARKTTLTTSAAENAVVDELQQTTTAPVAEMNESESEAKKPRTRKKSVTTEAVAEEKPKRTRAKKSAVSEPAPAEVIAAEEPAVSVEESLEVTESAVEPVAKETSPEPEMSSEAVAEVVESVEAERLVESYAGRSKEELVETLQKVLSENPVQAIRQDVEAIKVAFYKLHRAEVDAARRAFAEAEGEEAEFIPQVDGCEVRFKELLAEYRRNRDEYTANLDKVKEDNYKAKLEIIEALKELVNSDETLHTTFAKFRELQQRWKDTGIVPQQHVKDLWETYNLHVENFYNFIKINKELRDLDLKKNYEQKISLCEQAEALADEESIVESFHKLQKLHDEWRETGPVANEYKEALWSRFKEASTRVNKRHQEYFDNIKNEQLHNLERKSALCEKVEAMTAEPCTTRKAWNKANDMLLEIQKEWKSIGFAPRKENAKVYERFRAACDKFFELKREFYAEVKDEMEENLRLKTEICEAAEALRNSEEWKKATDELIALQAKWKEVGAVSRRHADAIWKRFRAACDDFFERKAKHFASIDGEYAENLAKKTALLAEMVAADVKEGGYELIKEFQRRWSEIGFVPIKAKEALQKQYKEAVDKMFAVVRGSERDRSINKFKEKLSTMKSNGEKRLRSERERLYNKVRQLEQDIALLENNIGFFSKSKGAEALIADVQQKIERAKRELAEAIEKVKLIDANQE
jgi:hypothetical protein